MLLALLIGQFELFCPNFALMMMHIRRTLRVTDATYTTPTSPDTTLSPSYNLPIGLVVLAIPLFFIAPWVSLAIALFGIFLLIQAVTLRLVFTASDLDIYRGSKLLRRFPYKDWQNWQIFWQPVPVLFYFKEVKSIHFLPILFNPDTLRDCLQQQQLPQQP